MSLPFVSEHEGVAKSPGADFSSQTEEEKAAVRLAEHLWRKAKRARSRYDKDWAQYFKYFSGEQWDQKRPSYRHSESINIIAAGIRNILPILTDPQPNVQTIPEDPTDSEFSEILNHIISSKWDRDNFNVIVAEAIIDACITGTAVGYVPWIQSLCDGIGDYTFETEDVAHVFPDPSAIDVNHRNSKFFCIAKPIDVQELREEYPKLKDKIKPDLTDAVTMNSYMDEAQEFAFKSPVDNRMMVPESRSLNQGNNPDLALKLEVYILSDEVVSKTETATDPQSGSQMEVTKIVKKYPNGRVICSTGGLLLDDRELEYEDGKFPYARLQNDIIPRSFWGEGEVKSQKSPQDIVNKLISYLLDYLIIMGNPIWVMDDEAMVDTDNVTNEPGMIVVKKKGSEVRREQGISPPPFILNTMQYFIGEIFPKLNGQNEISQGAIAKSGLSGEAISQLTEASQTRLRAKARNIDSFLTCVGQLIVSRILQFYTLPRIVRITGGQGEAAKYFKFSIEKQSIPQADGSFKEQRVASYMEYQPGDNGTGQWGPVKQIPLKSSLDVRITSGSALPLMKAQRDAQAERFFDKGILDPEDFLTTIDYPNKERIIAKLKERQAQAAQQPQPPQKGANGAPSAA